MDIGSRSALEQAFAAFDYRKGITNSREGLIFMSSGGTEPLRDVVRGNVKRFANDDYFRRDNYWLALSLAHYRIIVLYRGIGDKLHVKQSTSVPAIDRPFPVGQYNIVSFSDVRSFLAAPPPDVHLFLPEDKTGTRESFTNASESKKVAWPSAPEVPDTMEDFVGSFPLLSLETYPQVSVKQPASSACSRLQASGLEAAVICGDRLPGESNACKAVVNSDFTLLSKIKKEADNRFLISNQAECRIVHLLDKGLATKDCLVEEAADSEHITLRHASAGGDMPPYLKCASSKH